MTLSLKIISFSSLDLSSASSTPVSAPVSAPFSVLVSPATADEVTGVTGGNKVSAKLNLGGQQEYGRPVKAEKKKVLVIIGAKIQSNLRMVIYNCFTKSSGIAK